MTIASNYIATTTYVDIDVDVGTRPAAGHHDKQSVKGNNRNISANTLQKYNISDARCGRAMKFACFVYSVFSRLWASTQHPVGAL